MNKEPHVKGKKSKLAVWEPVWDDPAGNPGAAQNAPLETATLTIASSGTVSTSAAVGNPTDIGAIIGALSPDATITFQVSNDDSNWRGLVDKSGTAILALSSSSGAKAVSTNDLGAVLAYRYVRAVAGTPQTSGATITLCRKVSRTDPMA